MRLATMLRLRLRSLLLRGRVDRELDEELRYHVEREIEARVAAGLTPEAARRAAWREAAGLQQRKEECRDMRGLNPIDTVVHDVRFALRQLRKSPVFTSTAVITLALGLCASVAIFAFVDAALIRPLPYQRPARLVGVFERVAAYPRSNLSYPDYLDWKRLNTVFSSLAAYQRASLALATPEGARLGAGARVSDDFFRTLGIVPALGRDFRPGEDGPGAPAIVILSDAIWRSRYGGRADAIGQTVTLSGAPAVIVGVLPADAQFAPVGSADYWVPFRPSSPCDLRRSCHGIYGVARLKDGVSVQAAAADMSAIAARLERQYPDSNRGQGAAIVPLTDVIVGDVRPILLVLLGGAGLLLLIATVNVASLLLVRSESRKREMAVRSALGASTWRVVWQFVTEGVVLVAIAAAIGLAGARVAIQLLVKLIPADMMARMTFLRGLGFNARVAGFALAVVAIAAVLFALTPMVHLAWANGREALTHGDRGAVGTTWRRLGTKLVIAELAMAMVLLVGGALLTKSLYRVLQVDPGLQPDHLVSLGISVPRTKYKTDEQTVRIARSILDGVETLPGVTTAGLTSRPPLEGGNTVWIRVAGRPYHGEHNEVDYREVSAGYFEALGARFVAGRDFSHADDPSHPPVVVVNEAFVRTYFANEPALGQHLLYASNATQPPLEIIGIVADVKESALDSATPPAVYTAFPQDPTNGFTLFVRAAQADAILPTLVETVRRLDPDLSTFAARSMDTAIDQSPAVYLRRSAAWLVGGFAVLAWVLSVVGLYGVVAYSAGQRTREIGVRMALGAQRGSVYRLVLREAGALTLIGVVVGVACAVGAGSLLGDLLFGVTSRDIPTLAAVAAVLCVSALLASFVPARRAASINPVQALRGE
ncbi:MAG TPA: ABC transporter permease [Vicinamibacterales bacterium]|nr:ABC transporter permease [Vicinamibacterales bacterium]